jgi:hypothetical protein
MPKFFVYHVFELQVISSISFENDPRLRRIKSYAFFDSALESITIPRDVEICCSSCFGDYSSLSSVSSENDSRFCRIESSEFFVPMSSNMSVTILSDRHRLKIVREYLAQDVYAT